MFIRSRTRGLLLLLLSLASALAQSPKAPVADFQDVAEKAGLKFEIVSGDKESKKYIVETTGTGVAIFDYDNDGWPDIFIVNGTTLAQTPNGSGRTNHLFHNNHDGTFTDVTEKAGLRSSGWGQGVCAGDYDNDGFDDLYVTYYGKNRLYHNQGNGTFKELAEAAGVAGTGKEWGTGCSFVDYDRDGLLDIVVANYVDFDLATTPAPGQGTSCMWKGVPVMCGPRGLKSAPNVLYHNLGRGKFEDVSKKAGIDKTSGHYAFSVSTLDFDNDGWPDLLLVNGHVYPEVDKYKLGSDYQEPRILYRNTGKGTFEDVSSASGPAILRKASGRGLAISDLWNNGKIAAVITNMGEAPSLLVNQMNYPNHWMGIKTIGTKSNRDGIGARITMKANGRVFVDEVRSGSSYSSSNDMRVHFGLGAATKVESLEVRWPSGLMESFDPKVDAINTVREGFGRPVMTSKAAVAIAN